MLDKILIVNKHQAYMIFTDRSPVGLYSDQDVRVFVMWFLGDSRVMMSVNSNDQFIGLEFRNYDDEITLKIEIKEAA